MSEILNGAWRSVQVFDRKGKEEPLEVCQTYIFNPDGSALCGFADSPAMLSMRWKICEGRLHLKAVGSKGRGFSFSRFEMHEPNILVLYYGGGGCVFEQISKDAIKPWWTVRFAKRCKQLDYQDDEGRTRYFSIHFQRARWHIHAYQWSDENGTSHEISSDIRTVIIPRIVEFLHRCGWKDMVDVLFDSPPNTALEPTPTAP